LGVNLEKRLNQDEVLRSQEKRKETRLPQIPIAVPLIVAGVFLVGESSAAAPHHLSMLTIDMPPLPLEG